MSGPLPTWHLGADLHGAAAVLLVWLVAVQLLLGWWYAVGLRRVLRHAQGRRRHGWRAGALVAALVSLALVTLPPLGPLLDSRLSTHMAQHMVLITVTAPLLALAAPGQVLLAGMPARWRHRVVARLRRVPTLGLLTPHLAWALHVAALWLWHLPGAYDAALGSTAVHLLEHASFLGTAWLFWWHLATLGRRRLRGAAAAGYVALAVPPGAALGAVLTFAGQPLYAEQATLARAAGADPMLDQRLGGLIMWIPLDFVYVALALGLFAGWLRALARADRAGSRPGLTTLPDDARPLPARDDPAAPAVRPARPAEVLR